MSNRDLIKKSISIGLVFLLVARGIFGFMTSERKKAAEILDKTWSGYKNYFITPDGRVKRIKDGDTVSEGQAYAMLRAVWMNDQETFDRCYRWSEENLSRRLSKGDNLLAWQWKDGQVADWMPASDADVDYALSLIFASRRWNNPILPAIEAYDKKAKAILSDILSKLTITNPSGRVYLTPWIPAEKEFQTIPTNPSYYSPAHFRIFYRFTSNEQWLKLVDTTYFLVNALTNEFNGQRGRGLIPDWCAVEPNDHIVPLERKNSHFGWEAVRVPFRLALDYVWFGSPESETYFSVFGRFLQNEWQRQHAVFCEYHYDGTVIGDKYESPLFYAAYFTTLFWKDPGISKEFLNKVRTRLIKSDQGWVYQDQQEYYVNSLTWLAEGFKANLLKAY
jgi:endoglucanase